MSQAMLQGSGGAEIAGGGGTLTGTDRRKPGTVVKILAGLAFLPGIASAQLGPEFVVNTTTAGDQAQADVAVMADGSFIVTWQGLDGGSSAVSNGPLGIFARLFGPDGTPLGAEFRVNPDPEGRQTNPHIAVDATGRFTITYTGTGSPNGDLDIFRRRYKRDGTPLTRLPVRVNSSRAGGQFSSDVAATAAGDFVVAWRSDEAAGQRIRMQRFTRDGLRTGDETIIATSATSFDTTYPTVAAQFNGNVAVAYADSPRGIPESDVVVKLYALDNGLLNQQVYNGRFNPSLSVAGSGYALASDDAFRETGDYSVYLSRLNGGLTPAMPEQIVSDPALGGAFQSQSGISGNPSGDVIVGSTVFDGSFESVFAKSYNGSGQTLTPFAPLNAPGSRSRYSPAVALGRDGRGVAVWTDGDSFAGEHGLDGDGAGIVARRFSLPR